MNCPVCPQTDLPAEALACPNCGVDLTALRRVQQLGHQCYNEALALCASGDTSGAIAKLMAAQEMGAPAGNVHLLLGKLLWNAGREEEARASWRQIPASALEHAEAQQLLAMPSEPVPEPSVAVPPALAWPSWLAGILGLALVILFAAYVSYRGGQSSSNTVVNDLRSEVKQLRDKLAASPVSSDRLEKLATALRAIPAVTFQEEPGGVTVVFREGLFRGGSSRLVPGAAERLRAVGGVLAGHCAECRFTVEGVTDSIPMPRGRGDNPALGFARARRAAAVLQKQAGAKGKWTVAAAGANDAPFPNDTPENRHRNRTVRVHISLQPQAGAK